MSENNIVFDTSILLDYANGKEEARSVFLKAERRVISVLSRAEFLAMMDPDHGAKADAFLQSNFEVYPINLEVCLKANSLMSKHGLSFPNAMVAGTALQTKGKLVTKCKDDYKGSVSDIEEPY